MRAADKKAGSCGVSLLLEPQNKTNINNLNTIEETATWIEENRLHSMKLLMDIYHMNITEASIEGSLMACRDHIGMIHMSDSERLVPGFGRIPMENVLKALEAAGFKGFVSMEIRQEPDTETVAALSALSLRYMERKEI